MAGVGQPGQAFKQNKLVLRIQNEVEHHNKKMVNLKLTKIILREVFMIRNIISKEM